MTRSHSYYPISRVAVHTFSIFSICAAFIYSSVPSALAAPAEGLSSTLASQATDYRIGFGPFVGSGRIDAETKVRQASGYIFSFERGFQILDGLSVGPRLELANSFINTKRESNGNKSIGTYDNRAFAAGFSARYNLAPTASSDATAASSALYLSAVAGRGYSKLSIDESTDSSYSQNLFQGIDGAYFASEVGSFIPLKGNFGLDVALHGSMLAADQRRASGTFQGDRFENGALLLTEGVHTSSQPLLADKAILRTFGIKLGLTLGF